MGQYEVVIREIKEYTVEIEAESEEEAILEAYNRDLEGYEEDSWDKEIVSVEEIEEDKD